MAGNWRTRLFGYGYLFASLILGVALLCLVLIRAEKRPHFESLNNLPYDPVHSDVNSSTRKRHYLDGRDWQIALPSPGTFIRGMPIPLSFNLIKGMETYNGEVAFKKKFPTPEGWKNKGVVLVFLGSNYLTEVRLNGNTIGLHKGGYTSFAFDVTDALKPNSSNQLNELVVRVDNTRTHDTIPGIREGWVTYGGILREVYLEAFDKTFISRPIVMGNHKGTISVIARLANMSDEPSTSIMSYLIKNKAGEIIYESGAKTFYLKENAAQLFHEQVAIDDPEVWSPETPNLYSMDMSLHSHEGGLKDNVVTTFGFRSIEVRGHELLLNGEPVKLKGISRHEDLPRFAKTQPLAAMEKDVALLKELGVNTVRLGHYPSHPKFLELCDRAGLMLLEEIPAWGLNAEDLARSEVLETGRTMVEEMLLRDMSHPSVIAWGLANEIESNKEEGKRFIATLASTARRLDRSRPLYMASWKLEEDLAFPLLDFVAFNCYYGWYMKSMDDFGELLEKWHRRAPDKPIIVTEYGAGALKGYNGRFGTAFSEDYQTRQLTSYWKEIAAREYVAGGFIWAFADFEDNDRFMNPRPFYNLKGLVTNDRTKKNSFNAMRKIFTTGELPPEPEQRPAGQMFTLLANLGTALLLLIFSIATTKMPVTEHRKTNFRRMLGSAALGALFLHWFIFLFSHTIPFGTTMVPRKAGEILYTLTVSNWRLLFFFFMNLWLTTVLAVMMYVVFIVLRRKDVTLADSFPDLSGLLNFILPPGLLLNLPFYAALVLLGGGLIPEPAKYLMVGLVAILVAQLVQIVLIAMDYSRRFKIFLPIMLAILIIIILLPQGALVAWLAANTDLPEVVKSFSF